MNLKNALHVALDFEKKGYALYNQAAQQSTNPFVQKTFVYLAEQELYHIQEITMFIEQEHPTKKLGGDTREQTKLFFSTTIQEFKEKISLSDSDLKAYETALHLETSAYNFYQDQLNKTTDLIVKKFFNFLIEQENAHYELIRKAYDYIQNPTNFNIANEEWMFDGG